MWKCSFKKCDKHRDDSGAVIWAEDFFNHHARASESLITWKSNTEIRLSVNDKGDFYAHLHKINDFYAHLHIMKLSYFVSFTTRNEWKLNEMLYLNGSFKPAQRYVFFLYAKCSSLEIYNFYAFSKLWNKLEMRWFSRHGKWL